MKMELRLFNDAKSVWIQIIILTYILGIMPNLKSIYIIIDPLNLSLRTQKYWNQL